MISLAEQAGPCVPQTARGQQTQARIVESAAALMLEYGVTSTTGEQVCKKAGVSGLQLAHYFRDKRTLIRAVIAWQADRIIEFNTQAGATMLDSFDALREWAGRHIEMQQALDFVIGCRLGGLAGQLGVCDKQTRAEVAIGFERWARVVQRRLTLMRERGMLRADTPIEQLTTALLAAHQGGALLAQVKRDITTLREALDEVLDYIFTHAAQPLQ